MAGPHNLTLHTSLSQQSFQPNDVGSPFFSSSPLNKPISQSMGSNNNNNGATINSLEELLSLSGISNNLSNNIVKENGQVKRHFDDDIISSDDSSSKRMKLEENVAASSYHSQGHIPSILSHAGSSASAPNKSSYNSSGGMFIPLINPLSSSTNDNTLLKPSTALPPLSLDANKNKGNNESVALLVQLYKHYQSTGNTVGMSNIRQQLISLHSQLASKTNSYSYLASNSTSTTTTTNNISQSLPLLNAAASTSFTPITAIGGGNLQSFSDIPKYSFQPSAITSSTTNPVADNNSSFNSLSSPLASGLNSVRTIPSMPNFVSGLSNPQLPQSSQGTLNHHLPANNHHMLPIKSEPNPNAATLSAPTTITATTTNTTDLPYANGPSIVTHGLPTSTTGSSSSLTPSLAGLQVTAQTQANVLRAVYSYRLQQIQDFLTSLPSNQRPSTTNELRDLLVKHNILAKALPSEFITNLQKQLPLIPLSTTGQESTVASTTAMATAMATAGTVAASSSSLPVTTTPSTSSSGLLPGVTLETLRTLCRLPEAELIRIPMPSMLLTVVQYMRANKWSGNSSELPSLIQQAQEALAKGTLTTVTPQPPFTSATTVTTSSSKGSLLPYRNTLLPLSSTNSTSSINAQLKSNTSNATTSSITISPLSQYMASVGIKPTPTDIKSTTSFTAKPQTSQTINSSRPTTRYHSKALQEQAEKERLSALQKVLQSSEEARIAFRFQGHLDKLHQQINSTDTQKPFSSWQDLILRLLPYHIFREPELPSGAMEKADAVYEGIAGVLLSRSQGLMNQYQQILMREETRRDESCHMVLERLWLEGERERKEEEEKQRKEAEQIAAELSAVSQTNGNSFLDSDPFFLDSNSYMEDSFLGHFWDGTLNDSSNYDLGIT